MRATKALKNDGSLRRKLRLMLAKMGVSDAAFVMFSCFNFVAEVEASIGTVVGRCQCQVPARHGQHDGQVGPGSNGQDEARKMSSTTWFRHVRHATSCSDRQSITCFENRVGLSAAKKGSFVEVQIAGASRSIQKTRFSCLKKALRSRAWLSQSTVCWLREDAVEELRLS